MAPPYSAPQIMARLAFRSILVQRASLGCTPLPPAVKNKLAVRKVMRDRSQPLFLLPTPTWFLGPLREDVQGCGFISDTGAFAGVAIRKDKAPTKRAGNQATLPCSR